MGPEELKELRSRLEMSQETLGKEVGVRGNTVARWERGEAPIPVAVGKLIRLMAKNGTTTRVIASSNAITRDPYHRAITEALEGHLDPLEFEACAVDLLGRIWPGLVPVRGGSDDGFDGAVPSEDGTPFPLVATVGRDAARNLKRNLSAVRRSGRIPKRAIFATARRITPPTRKTLEKIAGDLGVQLIQILDQDWFANELYRDASWCKRLLGLSGRTSALSIMPLTSRPLLGDRVIGRDPELERLRAINGDCLVVGGPGTGKTFMLRAVALEGRALFLTGDDDEAIADAIREQRPLAIIVDDAHSDLERLARLKQRREEMRADFRIIAVSWPADCDHVAATLGLATGDILNLELIDADTMVAIIKSAGVPGPPALLRELVRQAEGRPGLAATLAYLCLRGDTAEVLSGEALARQLVPTLNAVCGEDSSKLLGAFSLPGAAGLSLAVVAKYLELGKGRISTALTRLGSTGVVRQSPDGEISVWPLPLRCVLVRDVFFSGVGTLQYRDLLESCRDRDEAMLSLIGARSRGASIPELESLLEGLNSSRVWSEYAWLGANESSYVLDRHTELAESIAEPGLEYVPDRIIPLLLNMVSKGEKAMDGFGGGDLSAIATWAAQSDPTYTDVICRRKTLVTATERWWKCSQDTRTAAKVLAIALSPGFQFVVSDPGQGRTHTTTVGLLGVKQLRRLVDLWPCTLAIIRSSEHLPWGELFGLVDEWLSPNPRLEIPGDIRGVMTDFAVQMIRDLVEISRNHPGLQRRLAGLAEAAGQTVPIKIDQEFAVLFPGERVSDASITSEASTSAAKALARRWVAKQPAEVAEKLAWAEAEAQLAGRGYPRETWTVCQTLADLVDDPALWAREFMHKKLAANLVQPFVELLAAQNAAPAASLLETCLSSSEYRDVAIAVLIKSEHPDGRLLTAALEQAAECIHVIETACITASVPESTLRRLLEGSDDRVALRAAIAEWQSGSTRQVRDGVFDCWRTAILRSAKEEDASSLDRYWLGDILAEDDKLAYDWLVCATAREDARIPYDITKLAEKAVSGLNAHQRKVLLGQLRATYGAGTLVGKLIGDDLELYKTLLKTEDLRQYHLSPLLGPPVDDWPQKAIAALDAGYTPEQIANVVLAASWSCSGPLSAMWEQRKDEFDRLKSHPDWRVARIGDRGAEETKVRLEQSLQREHFERVHGL